MTIQERKEKARRKEQLLNDLKSLDKSDPEDAHYKADMLIMEYIDDVNIKDAWMAIPRWYARAWWLCFGG